MVTWIAAALFAASPAHAQTPAPVEQTVCADRPTATSPVFQTAINNLSSFQYVNHAFERLRREIAHPTFCVSGFALSKNAYQYVRSYLQIDVRDEGGTVRESFRFLFQDASTQAFHNVGGQPWNGLPLAETERVFADWLKKVSPVPFATTESDPLRVALASRTYRENAAQADASTLAVFPLPGAGRNYLISWLGRPANNPYTAPVTPKAVMVSFDEQGGVSVAENLSLFTDVLAPLDDLLDESTHDVRGADRTETLLLISRP